MTRLKQDKWKVPEEHTLVFTEDGKAASWWWTPEVQKLLLFLGSPIPEMENLINNPYCG